MRAPFFFLLGFILFGYDIGDMLKVPRPGAFPDASLCFNSNPIPPFLNGQYATYAAKLDRWGRPICDAR
jgi:hypothetical protein